jgi:YVTN family beta-propeller protein
VGMAVTPDGRRLFVANGESDSVSVIDTGLG